MGVNGAKGPAQHPRAQVADHGLNLRQLRHLTPSGNSGSYFTVRDNHADFETRRRRSPSRRAGTRGEKYERATLSGGLSKPLHNLGSGAEGEGGARRSTGTLSSLRQQYGNRSRHENE